MSLKPNLSPLPPTDRQHFLHLLLDTIHKSPNLGDFRAIVAQPQDRQLAVFAALERAVLVGSPAAVPPKPDCPADMFLCDILECFDSHPSVANRGSAYGPDRHLANLQTLGLWSGRQPRTTPTALELFTTTFAALTADQHSNLSAHNVNSSPPSQVSAPNGDLIVPTPPSSGLAASASPALQVTVIPELADSEPYSRERTLPTNDRRINHHEPFPCGEQCPAPLSRCDHAAMTVGEQLNCDVKDQPQEAEIIPARPVRRGRPSVLDDLAKGRLLGLIAYGLSFRQAAAQLGIHHVTILNQMKRDEQFAQQVSEARLDAISQPLITVVRASRTSWRAAAWLAKFLDERHKRIPESTPEERTLAGHTQ